MAYGIEEKFVVNAPIDRVWSFLADPQRVVPCMPGVKITEVHDDRNFVGQMSVKLGPISLTYNGRVQITEMDAQNYRVAMTGDAREGGGWVKGSMSSQLTPTAEGSTEVAVKAEIEIAGRAIQFGRSLIQPIMKQQFGKFTDCLRKLIESA